MHVHTQLQPAVVSVMSSENSRGEWSHQLHSQSSGVGESLSVWVRRQCTHIGFEWFSAPYKSFAIDFLFKQ